LNTGSRWEFQAYYLDNLGEFGVSRAAAAAVKGVSVPNGRHLVSYAMQCAIRAIPDAGEKAGLLQALSQQPSMLVRLRVGKRADVHALADYWGRAMWATDVRAILESVKRRPAGAVISLEDLLPPQPSSWLHSYPPPHNPMAGPEAIKNCSWTTFNFFSDVPDPTLSDAKRVVALLQSDYYPIDSDPRYGDVAVLLNADKQMVHVALYLADDLYYTKNGENRWHPWIISARQAMLDQFSFGLPDGKDLSVHHFRSKHM
jgi:hypothetical protein